MREVLLTRRYVHVGICGILVLALAQVRVEGALERSCWAAGNRASCGAEAIRRVEVALASVRRVLGHPRKSTTRRVISDLTRRVAEDPPRYAQGAHGPGLEIGGALHPRLR